MEKLFSIEQQESSIFRNRNALLPEFVPAALLHRENQLKEIAGALKPALQHSKPQNLLIHGPTGSGKTSSVKYVFNEMKEYSLKVHCLHINCWEHPSKQSVLSHIAEQLKEAIPRRGLSDEEIFNRIVGRLKYEKKTAIIALDEMDRLLHKDEAEVLYSLSRAGENYGIGFGIIGITNSPQVFFSLDERARSSLRFREMPFPKYTPQELKDILRERAREALKPGACGEEAMALCAAHGAKNNGDARIAIETLLQAALHADGKGKERIEVPDVKDCISSTAEASLMKNVGAMGAGEKLVLEILKEAKKGKSGSITSGELYERFNSLRRERKQEALSERQIMNYLQIFESAHLVSADLTDDPNSRSGKTKIIRLLR